MQNAIERLAVFCGGSKKVFDGGPVRQLPFDKLHPSRQEISAAMAQIIENNSFMSSFGEQASYGTTYIPGSAGDQYLHKKLSFPKHFSLP
jgi:hypothetical protein